MTNHPSREAPAEVRGWPDEEAIRYEIEKGFKPPATSFDESLDRAARNVANFMAALTAAGALPLAPSLDNACLTSLAEQVPCRPDPNNLKRCTICGLVVDTAYSAEPPAKERRPR